MAHILTISPLFAPRPAASDPFRVAPNDRTPNDQEAAPEMKIEVVVEEPLVERAIEALQQLWLNGGGQSCLWDSFKATNLSLFYSQLIL